MVMVERFVAHVRCGFETPLKKVIETQTVAAAKEKSKVRSSIYASDYGSCMRKVFFNFYPEKYPVPEHDARLLRVFANGNDVHERLGGYLKRDPYIDFHDEVDVPRDDLDVHGRCDGTCTVDEVGVIVEFKSINKDEVYEPKDEHVGQLTFYLDMFTQLRERAREKYGDISQDEMLRLEEAGELTRVERWLLSTQGDLRGEIIYESKRNNSTFHFPVDYNPERVERVRLWFKQMKSFVERGEVPSRKPTRHDFPCSWGRPGSQGHGRCAYYDYCWSKDGVDGEEYLNKGVVGEDKDNLS
jgi:CRISPR/Cas system-associated exonuclease Cas4 (RecB family)